MKVRTGDSIRFHKTTYDEKKIVKINIWTKEVQM